MKLGDLVKFQTAFRAHKNEVLMNHDENDDDMFVVLQSNTICIFIKTIKDNITVCFVPKIHKFVEIITEQLEYVQNR